MAAIGVDTQIYGHSGKLYAQIQADSEIYGSVFEANTTEIVLAGMQHFLTEMPNDVMDDLIDNPVYREQLLKVINPSFVANILDLDEKSSAVEPIYSQMLKEPKGVALPCGINQHAIVLEFVLEADNVININVYNTGLGLNEHHESQLSGGAQRFRCCKRHRINLDSIPLERREDAMKNMIDMVLPQGVAHKELNDKIGSLYAQLEGLVMLYPGSSIDNNDSSLISGQRSGTCVWKSMFKYVREKVKAITNNDDLDLLFKYDIKLRSMREFMELLKSGSLIITKELIRTVIFSCQNNARLTLKLHSKGLITDANLANAMDLYEQMYALVPELNRRLYQESTFVLPRRYEKDMPPSLMSVEANEDLILYHAEQVEIDHPIHNAEDCITQLHALSEQIADEAIRHDKYFVALSEYIIAKCDEYLFGAKLSTVEQELQIVRDLHVIAEEYFNCALTDKERGFGEVRNLTLLTAAALACKFSLSIANIAEVRGFKHDFFGENNFGFDSKTSKEFEYMNTRMFTPLINATKKRIIFDPNLAKRFNSICEKIEELKRRCKSRQLILSFESLKEAGLLQEAELLWWTFCLIEKSSNLANMELASTSPKLYDWLQFRSEKTGVGGWSPITSFDVFIAYMTSGNPKEAFKIKGYTVGERTHGPTPGDKYILGSLSSVYSSGLIDTFETLVGTYQHTSTYIDDSGFAYMPKGEKITRADAQDNLLQSMFAEDGISLARLKEFVIEVSHQLNEPVYADLVLICLYKSKAIEKELVVNPTAVFDFLMQLKQIVEESAERKDSHSKQAIFPISLCYQTAWYILGFLEQCNDSELQDKLIEEIANINFLPLIDVKLAALEKSNAQDMREYGHLLAMKHLHYYLLTQLGNDLSSEQIVDLLNADMAAEMNACDMGYLSELCQRFASDIIARSSAKISREVAEKLAKNFAKIIGQDTEIISNATYDEHNHVLKFSLGQETATYSFDSGVAVLGEKKLTKIPRIFREDQTFIDSFDPPPVYCVVQNENQIRFNYKSRDYLITLTERNMIVQIADMQLYQPEKLNYYATKNIPLTMLDEKHEVFFDQDGKVEILDKDSKVTLYVIDEKSSEIIRTDDSANLILKADTSDLSSYARRLALQNDPVYASFARFEHPKFIEVWRLTDGTIEVKLPRYNIAIRYNPDQPQHIDMLLPHLAKYTLLQDRDFEQLMPNGILLLDVNAQKRVLLPQQHYVPQSATMKFDIIGAANFAESGNIQLIYNPEETSYQQTEKYINFKYDESEFKCGTGDEYFSLAYYLLGQDEYELAQKCLYKGIATSTPYSSKYDWLYNIIDFKPALTHAKGLSESVLDDPDKINLNGTCHVGVRVLALYLYCCETALIDTKDKDFLKKALQLLQLYYKNLNNIPIQFQLSSAQELQILSIFNNYDMESVMQESIHTYPILAARFEAVSAFYSESKIYSLIEQQNNIKTADDSLEITLELPTEELMLSTGYQVRDENYADSFNKLIQRGISQITLPKDFFLFYFAILQCKQDSYEAMKLKSIMLRLLLDKKLDPTSRLLTKWLLYIFDQSVENPSSDLNFPQDVSKYNKRIRYETKIDIGAFLRDLNLSLPLSYKIPVVTVQNNKTSPSLTQHSSEKTTAQPLPIDLRPLFAKVGVSQTYMHMARKRISSFVKGVGQVFAEQSSGSDMNAKTLHEMLWQNQELSRQILEMFNKRPDLQSKLTTLAARKPKLTLEQIMQLFVQQDMRLFQDASYMSAEECKAVNKLIFEYLLRTTQIQKIKRNEAHLPRGYAATDDPRLVAVCLLFESESAIGMYPLQVENIKYILDQQDNPNSIVQMAMGQGKTKIMAPIISIANANGENLSIYITPKELYNTTLIDMSVATYRIFNKIPVGISFERKDLNAHKLMKILQSLKAARKDRNFIIMSPDTIHALYLSRIECAITRNAECKAILDEIMQLFKEHGVCTIDEIDQVLNLLTEYNYASLAAKSLEQKFPLMISTVTDFYAQIMPVVLPYDPDKTILDLIAGAARKPKDDAEWSALTKELANTIYLANFSQSTVSKEDIIDCLMGSKDIESLGESLSQQEIDRLTLLKFEISELFRITINSPFIEKYAATKKQAQQFVDVLAIPHSMSLPIPNSEFSDPVTTINYTTQAFLHNTTLISKDLLLKFKDDIKRKYGLLRSPQMRKEYLLEIAALFGVKDKDAFKLSMIDEEFIDWLVMRSASKVELKMYLLRYYILPEIIENDFELQSNAYTINSTFKSVTGFSGTLENLNIFHESMRVANRKQGLAIDQAIIDRLNSLKPHVTTAATDHDIAEQLQMLMAENVAKGRNLHAIIDVGAAFKTMGNNLAVAKTIAANVKAPITHILYFEGNDLWALPVDTHIPKLISNTEPETIFEIIGANPDQYFTFYDQAHTIGINIQHATNAHAIVTLGEDNLQRDLLQGSMRMRGLKQGGSQTIEIFVSEAAKQRQPQLENWSWDEVLSFVKNNSLNFSFEMNYRAAQILMMKYLHDKIQDIALSSALAPEEYLQMLKAIKDDSLFVRYGKMPEMKPVELALQAFRDALIAQANHYPEVDVEAFKVYCDKVITRYKGICKAKVSTTVSTPQANTARLVVREQQQQQLQQLNKDLLSDQYGVQTRTVFSNKQPLEIDTLQRYLGHCLSQDALSLNALTWDKTQKYYSGGITYEIADPFTCRTSAIENTELSPFNDSQFQHHIYCNPRELTDFYKTEDEEVADELRTVTKNAYYIAVLVRPNLPNLHFLISEEGKDKLELELSDFAPYSHTWPDKLPPGYSLSIFTKNNNLEFSTRRDDITLDPGVLLRMHMFNADIYLLLDMLKGENAAIVKYFFATQTQEKLQYLKDKVSVFRPDQNMYFAEFEKKIYENIRAKPIGLDVNERNSDTQGHERKGSPKRKA